MSAVATTQYAATPELHLIVPSAEQLAQREMYRWMLWFGLPSLVAAVFVGLVFATGSMWWISGAIAGVLGAITVLVWLAMSSCTNRV